MSDPIPKADTPAASSAIKKDRSPSFPFITLSKAVERARELYTAARQHEMRLADAASAMNYGAKSSGAIQSLAALIAFGLLEDSGSGEARKFRISDLGLKALEDQRPGAREAALKQAATMPKTIAEYAEKWKGGRPADSFCISDLRFENGFTEEGAKSFLRVFDDAMTYAKVGDADKESDTGDDFDALLELPNRDVGVGDWVRVELGGQIVFEKTRVRAINGPWVFVEASESGTKMADVTLLEKASSADELPPTLPLARDQDTKVAAGEEMDRFTVDEGVVKIVFPTGMTTDSVDELEQFLNLFIKKAKRRAGADKKPS